MALKRIQLHGPDDVRIDEVPAPEPGPRDALVRVEACGICGSDLGYIRLGGVVGPTGRPMPLGHELAGVVEAVGREVESHVPGQRVVVNPMAAGNQIGNGGDEGAFAPFLLVRDVARDRCLVPIPDGLAPRVAALAEPLGVGMQALDRASVEPGEKVVVFGAGPIGLAAVAAARHRGVDDVIAVDFSPARRSVAEQLGARATLDPASDDVWAAIRDLHGTEPVLGTPMAATDAYVEASGAGAVIGQVLGQCKEKARLSVVALHRNEVPVSFMLLMMKQAAVVGALGYPDDWTRMLDLLASVDLSPMVTHRFPLDRFHEALAVARDPAAGAKVMIEL